MKLVFQLRDDPRSNALRHFIRVCCKYRGATVTEFGAWVDVLLNKNSTEFIFGEIIRDVEFMINQAAILLNQPEKKFVVVADQKVIKNDHWQEMYPDALAFAIVHLEF